MAELLGSSTTGLFPGRFLAQVFLSGSVVADYFAVGDEQRNHMLFEISCRAQHGRFVPQHVALRQTAAIAAEWQGSRPQELKFEPSTTNANQLIATYCAACHGPALRGGMQRGLLLS